MDDAIFETRELKLAVWMLYQPGVELRGIKTEVKKKQQGRDGKPRCLSTFVLDLTDSVRSEAELFALWMSRDPGAYVEVNEYEQVRGSLMAAMKESHKEALQSDVED